VIGEEIENHLNGIHSVPTVFFYCARDSAGPFPDEILRSIARKLSSTSAELPIREPARMKYDEVYVKGFGCGNLSLEESVQLILSLFDKNPAMIVVDTLDECDPSRRYELINGLEEILHRSTNAWRTQKAWSLITQDQSIHNLTSLILDLLNTSNHLLPLRFSGLFP
jgi:hypothetical protein